jgi:hypothetical protein
LWSRACRPHQPGFHGHRIARKTGKTIQSSAERANSYLKDNYGGRNIRVKGASKAMAHLMFGVVSITAMQIFRLLL